jgi:acyl carrier protein
VSQQELFNVIVEALAVLGCKRLDVAPHHRFDIDLGIDSLEVVELGMIVCSRCGIASEQLDFRNVRTLGDLATRFAPSLRPAASHG